MPNQCQPISSNPKNEAFVIEKSAFQDIPKQKGGLGSEKKPPDRARIGSSAGASRRDLAYSPRRERCNTKDGAFWTATGKLSCSCKETRILGQHCNKGSHFLQKRSNSVQILASEHLVWEYEGLLSRAQKMPEQQTEHIN